MLLRCLLELSAGDRQVMASVGCWRYPSAAMSYFRESIASFEPPVVVELCQCRETVGEGEGSLAAGGVPEVAFSHLPDRPRLTAGLMGLQH
jgi:hypothetical protein